MPYTMEDLKRDLRKETLAEMTPEELLTEMPPELQAKFLSENLVREKVLGAMSLEDIREYLRQHEKSKPPEETDSENPESEH